MARSGKFVAFLRIAHVFHRFVEDLQELLATAQNNGYKKACFFVLDPDDMKGGSPQLGDAYTTCPDLVKGSEKFYILFPKTDLEMILYPYIPVNYVETLALDQIKLTTASAIIYKMNYQMKPLAVILGHGFQKSHDELVRQGQISSDYTDPAYIKNLLDGILYFNSTSFVSTPSMSNPWDN
jgi:hypothetical protein